MWQKNLDMSSEERALFEDNFKAIIGILQNWHSHHNDVLEHCKSILVDSFDEFSQEFTVLLLDMYPL